MTIWVTEQKFNHSSEAVKAVVQQAISSGKWLPGTHYIRDQGKIMINANELIKIESGLRQTK